MLSCCDQRRIFLRCAWFCCAAMSVGIVLSASAGYGQSPSLLQQQDVQRLFRRLGHDSYPERRFAQRRLFDLANDPSNRMVVSEALKRAIQSADPEIRESASRILQETAFHEAELEVARLLDSSTPAVEINLPLWDRFQNLAGDDIDSRKLFAKLACAHFEYLKRLSLCEVKSRATKQPSRSTLPAPFGELLDPYLIAADDAPIWALLLCADHPSFRHGISGLSTRTTMALSQTGGGPSTLATNDRSLATNDSSVLHRMIGNWLDSDHGICLDRERLKIAMKYRCYQQATRLSQRVLNDRFAAPSAHAMALLCASALELPDLDQCLMQRINDRRAAHVWQLIASRKTKIRTQVGDVALALMLHQRGIDPRKVGFVELQADPLVVFREHSLGFSSESQRRNAYAAAKRLIKLESKSVPLEHQIDSKEMH